MRATKAYIASAGTAAVMLACSVCLFAMVSALVAFGSWPGDATPTSVDELLVTAIEHPKPQAVAVRRDAPLERRAVPGARTTGASRTTVAGRTPNDSGAGSGTTAGPGADASAPIGAAQGGSGAGQTATQPGKVVTRTTQPLLENAPKAVQDVTNQVDQVIDQVGSALPPPETVNNTVNGVLGH